LVWVVTTVLTRVRMSFQHPKWKPKPTPSLPNSLLFFWFLVQMTHAEIWSARSTTATSQTLRERRSLVSKHKTENSAFLEPFLKRRQHRAPELARQSQLLTKGRGLFLHRQTRSRLAPRHHRQSPWHTSCRLGAGGLDQENQDKAKRRIWKDDKQQHQPSIVFRFFFFVVVFFFFKPPPERRLLPPPPLTPPIRPLPPPPP
jgi:hypothetical protein